MKIGIITLMGYENYGNRLQNYAVHRILNKNFGCKAVSLASYKEKPFNDGNYIGWFKERIAKLLCVVPSFAEKRFGNNITRWANFTNWSKRIPTKNYYRSINLPDKVNNEYDFFFAGSDQIWNCYILDDLNDYFLKFADDKKKVAISASFGLEEIPDGMVQEYVDGLKGFSHISVREEAGLAIIKELIGRDVPVLIDPVMMLSRDEWLKVSKKPRVDCTKPYILKYYLGNEKEEDKIDNWAKKNGYEVYELLNADIPELYSAGPGEFITLISNAALVCSDSFHCIAFSIIFSRPFVVYDRLGKENYMSSRLETLLNKFGFRNRWRHLLSEDEYLYCDYSLVKETLAKEQQKFSEYVGNILNRN